MAYSYSDNERANAKWFENDPTRQSLKAITVEKGAIRGLSGCRIEFRYPVSAIAGKNGSGKSTFLALAACAFHNEVDGWRLPDRKLPYYTFSDFFIQASGDVPVEGITVAYRIFSDQWASSESLPDGVGLGVQRRRKSQGGKWNDYDLRHDRSVAFLGIERVVPHAERSVYKSYRYSFSASKKAGWEEKVKEAVSKVLGTEYTEFEIQSHGKYRLPVVSRQGNRYSGFNMGAGEKALFEVFAAIFAAPDGALFLIDEIELGLHESAQRTFIRELSQVCCEKKIQVICTTHSPAVLAALPPEGRFLIQAGNRTQVINGISPAFAVGRLSDSNSEELIIYVEDAAARTLMEAFLGYSLLRRIKIIQVGSHSAVVHQLAAKYIENSPKHCAAVLDGDQQASYDAHLRKFVGYCGGKANAELNAWGRHRMLLLPHGRPPEHWVFEQLRKCDLNTLADTLGIEGGDILLESIDAALLAEAHSSVHEFCRVLGITGSESLIWRDCCRSLAAQKRTLLDTLLNHIAETLDS